MYVHREFKECTTYGNNGVFWCATEVNWAGWYVPNSGKWGTCTEKCPKEGKKYNTGTLTEKHVL